MLALYSASVCDCQPVQVQMYDVAQILQQCRPGVHQSGAAVVTKLTNGQLYDRSERMWLTKVLSRHLMENCKK